MSIDWRLNGNDGKSLSELRPSFFALTRAASFSSIRLFSFRINNVVWCALPLGVMRVLVVCQSALVVVEVVSTKAGGPIRRNDENDLDPFFTFIWWARGETCNIESWSITTTVFGMFIVEILLLLLSCFGIDGCAWDDAMLLKLFAWVGLLGWGKFCSAIEWTVDTKPFIGICFWFWLFLILVGVVVFYQTMGLERAKQLLGV